MLKQYRADRAFDAFTLGQVVELDDTDEQHKRWLNTGYLEPVDDDADGQSDEARPSVADQPTSTDSAAPGDAGEPDGQESEDGVPESTSGAGPVKSSRRRS
jgi:hypothetical protein